jgi:polyisoprenoid-binding protein YceI
MKTIKLLALLLIAGTISITAQKKDINVSKSVVTWTGNKIGGSHNGGINIKSGHVEFKNGNITAGTIVIDMKSMTNADIKNESMSKKLLDHLKSDDFFGVDKFPTATFTLKSAGKFVNGKATLTGVLTIKGKSENISFDVTKNGEVYAAQLKVDRSKYDVRYGSKSFFDNLGDKAIDDIFVLDIKIVL